jgi:hypothetical protein
MVEAVTEQDHRTLVLKLHSRATIMLIYEFKWHLFSRAVPFDFIFAKTICTSQYTFASSYVSI